MLAMMIGICLLQAVAAEEDLAHVKINPVPRAHHDVLLKEWDFQNDTGGWTPLARTELFAQEGRLVIEATGHDPYFLYRIPAERKVAGKQVMKIRARCNNGGTLSLYWATTAEPELREARVVHDSSLQPDDQWREHELVFDSGEDPVVAFRIDPGTHAGRFEIDSLRWCRRVEHPIFVTEVEQTSETVVYHVQNDSLDPITARLNGRSIDFDPAQRRRFEISKTDLFPSSSETTAPAVAGARLEIEVEDFASFTRTAFVWNDRVEMSHWPKLSASSAELLVAPDGSGGVFRWRENLGKDGSSDIMATLAPLVHRDGKPVDLNVVHQSSDRLELHGEDLQLIIRPPKGQKAGDEFTFEIRSNRQVEGPVLCARGELTGGILSGVEYLGPREWSSSKLDVTTEKHLRFRPPVWWLTMPMMNVETERGTVTLRWPVRSMFEIQPTYATPNFFDGTDEHRMSLEGKHLRCAIRVSRQPQEEEILRTVRAIEREFPQPPPLETAPRSDRRQLEFCLNSLTGIFQNENGWSHCVNRERWKRHPYGDQASTTWRLKEALENPVELLKFDAYALMGGAHVDNETIWFIQNQVDDWLHQRRRYCDQLLERQQPDGSFHYRGEYSRGFPVPSTLGTCARPAWFLLQTAQYTGNEDYRKAGLRTLEFMKRFRVPRGAQVWEMPLHTPDLLASAYAVRAYVLGHALTDREAWLKEARRWAITGLPFVYFWNADGRELFNKRNPMMQYATTGVLGATNWKAPFWIGRPVQWIGTVYAYALLELAPHDTSYDWKRLAEGILISSEWQQYPEGEFRGALPDSIDPKTGQRYPWNINPCALVSLRLRATGRPDSLFTAQQGKLHLVAPYPMKLIPKEGTDSSIVSVEAKRGVSYQILITRAGEDRDEIRTIDSVGLDRLEISP